MPSPSESRAALILVTSAAVSTATQLVQDNPESPVEARLALLDTVPGVIAYYSDGSSALAADFYDDEREAAAPKLRFAAEPVVVDREEKIRRAIAWASQPWFEEAETTVATRLAEVVQLETARPYRDTITTNSRRDPSSVGWRRISAGGCKFCRMLADKGAIFRESTARFASHKNCHCTAQPVFDGQGGEEASVLQYVASQKRRSEKDRKRLRDYLASMPD